MLTQPSPSLDNLQFNKIQCRQLRVAHPDDHYCAAIVLYIKQLSVVPQKECTLFFCDDKAKVNVGEPGIVVSTNVGGKQTLAPSFSIFSATDHDIHHKGSFSTLCVSTL